MPTLKQWREVVLAPALSATLSPERPLPVDPYPGERLATGAPAGVIYQGFDGLYIDEAPGDDLDYCHHQARFSALLVAGPPYARASVDLLDHWVGLLPAAMRSAAALVDLDGDGPPRIRSVSAPLVVDYGGNRYHGIVAKIVAAKHYL